MTITKKILLSSAVFYLLGAAAATAEVNVDLSLGGPAYVAAPAPVYVSPYPTYYDPAHRGHDFRYWQERHRAEHVEARHDVYDGHRR